MADESNNNPTPPDEPTPDADASNLAERKSFKPSGETRADGALTKKGKAKKDKPEPTTALGKLWYGWIKPIGSVIIIVVVVRSMLIDWNDVPSGSMEPEIHIGDRVAVNRLAYGLQFPLTGPTIGIPFTPLQTNNPLDGIPQIAWAEPKRGDIVTFWNPVSDIRMIKRIVAVSGDTIEIRNSKMIINGEIASYEAVDALAEGLPVTTKYGEGIKTITRELIYRRETLLDQARMTQHIEANWPGDSQLIDVAGMGLRAVENGQIKVKTPTGETASVSAAAYLRQYPQTTYFELKDGQITKNGVEVGYQELAAALLARFETGPIADILAKMNLGVKGHELLIDGEPAFIVQFLAAFESGANQLPQAERAGLVAFDQTIKELYKTTGTNFGPYTVPDGHSFMVGDNRNNSSDSRFFGPVANSEITGKAFGVAFSFDNNDYTDPEWTRFFQGLD